MSNFKQHITAFCLGILNSYGQVFFSQHKLLSVTLLVVTFFDFKVGFYGLLSTAIAQLAALFFGNRKEDIKSGVFAFNSLLVGLGIGVYYELNIQTILLTVFISILTYFVCIWFSTSLGRRNLPFLSLPFVLTTWIVVMGANNFSVIQFATTDHISTINQLFPTLNESVNNFVASLGIANFLHFYFRSLGAIIFQYNDLAGILIAIALLINSRISFTLSVLGFSIGYLFYQYFSGDFTEIIYSYIGFNFILTAIALGGFFIIPSKRSFAILLVAIPVAALLLSFFSEFFGLLLLPIYSLPFNVVVLLVLSSVGYYHSNSKLKLTPNQLYSPEDNLDYFNNIAERELGRKEVQFTLPFIGEWRVSQGYNGGITHIGSWQYALDFDIERKSKTFKNEGDQLSDYFCYKLPVVAPAEGVVVKIIDGIDDNEIGEIDTVNNWGNTIIIKHSAGVYSKLSHLKKNSFKVVQGQFVKRNQVLAKCGSSGRSPEPHLHFQVQNNAFIDASTIEYPLAYYLDCSTKGKQVGQLNSVPEENTLIKNLTEDESLYEAFRFKPKDQFILTSNKVEEKINVLINEFNQFYFLNEATGDRAYFINNDLEFYFTKFEGNHKSLLYQFYVTAYRVPLSSTNEMMIQDNYIRSNFNKFPMKWVVDFIAPFYTLSSINFTFKSNSNHSLKNDRKSYFCTECVQVVFKKSTSIYKSEYFIEEGRIKEFTTQNNELTTTIICSNYS